MLTSLFPRAHARYSSLPLIGPVLEALCQWLHAKGYPENAIRRRITGAPLLERWLRRSHIRSLQDCDCLAAERVCAETKAMDRPHGTCLGSVFGAVPHRARGVGLYAAEPLVAVDCYLPYVSRARAWSGSGNRQPECDDSRRFPPRLAP